MPLFVVSCKERKPHKQGAYIIWIGSPVVAVGHQADSYTKMDGMITFTDINSLKTIAVPICNVLSVDSNID